MGKKDKGATAVKDRADARAKEAAGIAMEGVHQVADSAQRLGEAGARRAHELGEAGAKKAHDLTEVGAKKAHDLTEVGAKRARKANKKMKKSVRRHPAGWGAAAFGLVVGAILGIAVRRRRA
jgi:ElaB/YqjD/DUF883 family membrane-anchored ribosome-binding protein